MSFFDSILEKRNLKECPLPLWKLKLTGEEFEQLRNLLERQTHVSNRENPFDDYERESILFFAEYWRRKYEDRGHIVSMVYNALNSTQKVDWSKELHNAAIKGADILKIERYEGGNNQQLRDMFYQGGLPMKKLLSSQNNDVWGRFTRQLVTGRISIENLSAEELGQMRLGKVASQSKSLKEFCEAIFHGVELNDFTKMPFDCENEYNEWFRYLKDLARDERTKQHQQHPFYLDFEFTLNRIDRIISVDYIFKGSQSLSAEFLQDNNLDNPYICVQVRKNYQTVDTFEYYNNNNKMFCPYAVRSQHTYKIGDQISILLGNKEELYDEDSVNMNVPYLLYRKNEKYVLGNRIGREESVILIPNGWSLESETDLKSVEYSWGETMLNVLRIPSGYSEAIVLKSKDESITFGQNVPLYWTKFISSKIRTKAEVIEPIYNARQGVVKLCTDLDEEGRSCPRKQFRSKWEDNWTSEPSYGEIFVRAIEPNGNFVTSEKIINVGNGLVIDVTDADSDSCKLRVKWSHGNVSVPEGTRVTETENVWKIKKADCRDSRKIRLSFTPPGNPNNHFEISVKAPFCDFWIKDPDGNDVKYGSCIPLSDIERYWYHCVGVNFRYYYNYNEPDQLSFICNDNVLSRSDGNRLPILYEDCLTKLLSKQDMLSILEKKSQSIGRSKIDVLFMINNRPTHRFTVKEFPYRAKQVGFNVTIKDNTGKPYDGRVKLFKLDAPEKEPIEFRVNAGDPGHYTLPEEAHQWGKAILIGCARGRILPKLIVFNNLNLSSDEKIELQKKNLAELTEKLQTSLLGDDLWNQIIGWFGNCFKYDIPASSLAVLRYVAKNYQALIYMAFQLYVNTEEYDLDRLKINLTTFSNDLAFQWYWLQPYFPEFLDLIKGFIDNPNVLYGRYFKWVSEKYDSSECGKYLTAWNQEPNPYMKDFIEDLVSKFTLWMKELCVSSLVVREPLKSKAEDIINNEKLEMLKETIGYIETNQGLLGDAANEFFNNYQEEGKTGNEMWLCKRVNAVAAHLRKEVDLFSQIGEVRRSIMFCNSACNEHFIIYLNNKLHQLKLNDKRPKH